MACPNFLKVLDDGRLYKVIIWRDITMPDLMIQCLKDNGSKVEVLACYSKQEESEYPTKFTEALNSLRNVQIVDFTGCEILRSVEFAKNCPNIEVMSLTRCTNLCPLSLNGSFDGLQNLKYFECIDVPQIHVFEIVEAVAHLQKLEMINCFKTGDMKYWNAKYILKYCPSLKYFMFSTDTSEEQCGSYARLEWYKLIKLRYPEVKFNTQISGMIGCWEMFEPRVVNYIDAMAFGQNFGINIAEW